MVWIIKLCKALVETLKWRIAGEEMEELRNYRRAIQMAKREMHEFPDAMDALQYIEGSSKWPPGPSLIYLSNKLILMRDRRRRLQLTGLRTFKTEE
jgi:hypothetical protein